MTWSGRRQLIIVLLLLALASIVAFFYIYPIVTKAPSCRDGKQNGTETGVDCGGGCVNFCSAEIKTPIVLWSRAFAVTPSVYNAAAYIENQNKAVIQSIPYEFRLYNKAGVLVNHADGVALIPPLGRYAIVETGIKVGNAKVAKTTLAFGPTTSPWLHVPENIASLHISINDVKMSDTMSIPKLSATLGNPSNSITLNNTVVAVILYDASDNAITVSKTVVPIIGAGVSVPVFFTWPAPITTPIVRYDIIPIIDVFHTSK
jgi:hypothetical protein